MSVNVSEQKGKLVNKSRRLDNVGYIDRIVRFLIALGLIGVVLSYGGAEQANIGLATIVALIALYPIVTAVMAWDPVYKLIGVSSRKNKTLPSDKDLEHAAEEVYDKAVEKHVVPPSGEKQEEINQKKKNKKIA